MMSFACIVKRKGPTLEELLCSQIAAVYIMPSVKDENLPVVSCVGINFKQVKEEARVFIGLFTLVILIFCCWLPKLIWT